ncbi:MAG: hypothetical protein QNJ46_07555 [Leptolyngbyaceae cyanobacterium MO_188.B28]|nr:hypothetical protein [Leptolyngbyaceae cyanobacterium MO_188.B28]
MTIKEVMDWQRSSTFYTSGEEAAELQEMDTDISDILNQLNGLSPKPSRLLETQDKPQRWNFGFFKLH